MVANGSYRTKERDPMRRLAFTLAILSLPAFAPGARADEPPRPSSRAEAVFSEAEGDRAILYIVPEGSRVTKGQVVCVLDSGPESDALKIQRINVRQADASYGQARLTREVAEIAVKDYEQGVFRQNVETTDGEIALAMAELKRAEDRLAWTRRVLEKTPPRHVDGGSRIVSDKLSVDKARFVLEQVRTKKDVLLKYTKDKTLKELRAEVEKARSDELAKKVTLDAERARAKALEATSRPGVVLAPVDGTVALAKPARLVATGSEVCKDQLLLRVVPSGK
jgi:HlyD family secretion protein